MDDTTKKKLDNDNQQVLFDIAEVYNFAKASEFTKTFSSLTLDNFIQEAIDDIETRTSRPSKKDRLKNIENLINSISEKLN